MNEQSTHTPTPVLALEPRSGIYLLPSQLEPSEANKKARPAERPDARQQRVEAMAHLIAREGQIHPVLVVEAVSEDEFDEEGNPLVRYEYVDGGARVDAIDYILKNPTKFPEGTDSNLSVWCTVVDSREDLFRMSVSSNLHRTQNSLLDIAYIIQEVRETHGWKGRGGQAKVCEYLGLPQNRVSDYEKLLRAPQTVRDLISSGEIGTLDAAMRILTQKDEDVPLVLARAKELAQSEQAERTVDRPDRTRRVKADAGADAPIVTQPEKELSELTVAEARAIMSTSAETEPEDESSTTSAPTASPSTSTTTKKRTLTAQHIARAAKELTKTATPLTRAQIIQSFLDLTGLPYPPAVQKWIDYFVDEHCTGKGSEEKFQSMFEAAFGGSGGGTADGGVEVSPTKSKSKRKK